MILQRNHYCHCQNNEIEVFFIRSDDVYMCNLGKSDVFSVFNKYTDKYLGTVDKETYDIWRSPSDKPL